jgi:hypothetical protein
MGGIKNVFMFAIVGATANVLVALLIPATRLPAPEEKGTSDDRESVNGTIDK